jgi:hypothetical protein
MAAGQLYLWNPDGELNMYPRPDREPTPVISAVQAFQASHVFIAVLGIKAEKL